MQFRRLREILEAMCHVSVGVLGDFCLDAYWDLDTEHPPEHSVETGKPTHAVARQRYELGGASNVAQNLVSLGVSRPRVFGVLGDDPFGRELRRLLREKWIGDQGLLSQDDRWDTPLYAKPYVDSEEQERIDFGCWNELKEETGRQLMESLASSLPELDLLIVNSQLPSGLLTDSVVKELNRLCDEYSRKGIVADIRTDRERLKHAIHKVAVTPGPDMSETKAVETAVERAQAVFEYSQKPVFVTLGHMGCVAFDGEKVYAAPGVKLAGSTDAVGAGDCFVSAVAASLAAGASVEEAAELANFAAAATVSKIGRTGTASPEEVLRMAISTPGEAGRER